MFSILEIKSRYNLTWEDLPFIEAPAFAHHHAFKAIQGRDPYTPLVQNLEDFRRAEVPHYDPFFNHDYVENHLRRLFFDGQYFSVSRPKIPFAPIFKWNPLAEHPDGGEWIANPFHYSEHCTKTLEEYAKYLGAQKRRKMAEQAEAEAIPAALVAGVKRVVEKREKIEASPAEVTPQFKRLHKDGHEEDAYSAKETDLLRVMGKENRQMEIDALRKDPKALQQFLIDKGHTEIGRADGLIGKNTQTGIDNYINGFEFSENSISFAEPRRAQEKIINLVSRSGSPYENDYDQIIWDASEKYGVPPEILKAKIRKESTFNNAASNSNNVDGSTTVGLGQFTEDTARARGLRVDSIVDERLDPTKTIPKQAEYLKAQYDRFRPAALSDADGWRFALAAYNLGPKKVGTQLNIAKPYMTQGKIAYDHSSMTFVSGSYTPTIMGSNGEIGGWAKEYSGDFTRFKK